MAPHGTIWSRVKATSDSPFLDDDHWRHLETRPAIRPLQDFRLLGCIGTQFGSMRTNADSAKIEPVSIPTGLNGDVGVGFAIGVTNTSGVEQIEIWIRKLKDVASESSG